MNTPAPNVTSLPVDHDATPRNIEAEQALLGALLVNNAAVAKVQGFLLPEHFYEPVHERIYAAILSLTDNGEAADALTLKHYFDHDGALSEIGGSQYLARLAGDAVTVVKAEGYGRIVSELYARRELIAFGRNLITTAEGAAYDEHAGGMIEQGFASLDAIGAVLSPMNSHIRSASQMAQDGLRAAEEAYQRDGALAGVSTGLGRLDAILGGMKRGQLIVLAGRPSMGKSALAVSIAHAAANLDQTDNPNGAGVGFFSIEMTDEEIGQRILAIESRIPVARQNKGDLSKDDFARLIDASKRVEPLEFWTDDRSKTLGQIRAAATRKKRQGKLGLLVVDYIQLMQASNDAAKRGRVDAVTELTGGLKAMAKELDVPVLALSQLSRQVESREDKRPTLADLRDSGSIEQDADVVMFVYREEYYLKRETPQPRPRETDEAFMRRVSQHSARLNEVAGLADIIVAKQRQGPTGTAKLHFAEDLMWFRDTPLPRHEADTQGRLGEFAKGEA